MKRWLLAALLLTAPATTHADTLSSLISQSRILARDTGTTRQRFTDAQITQFLNDAQDDAAVTGKLLEDSVDISLTVGTTYYALPSNFLQVKRVLFQNRWVKEKTPEALDLETDGWEEIGGYPKYYFINFSTRTRIGFMPWPDSTSSTGTAKVDYFAQSSDMSASSDVPFGGVTEFLPYHHALVVYAAYRMCAIDGQTDLAMLYWQEWQAELGQMNSDLRMRPSYSPSAIGSRDRARDDR